ncbi:MAG: ACP S-malonyltransferase [Negativicoccus massiliensis]|uniref:ACP S-malonyltransferase n=1 Tax=Negativicoccus succinicivorans TaxID=620903 RepID=UPI0026F175FC|nr:ACP S-malonyltransferase [Negativicoccus succinicivorans]MBS5888059.1 ACP S-malonyltransferase [Negativicoccus succinicivorans]MDU3214935.1 ACP S-malonyltransferase [Negativicoccus succinicivorans]MDU4642386.1 ACP S-malonyltransferase [Negativicoccus massiliensis]MDU5028046.1 ACP S-malonyltransferase [Negativicoccus succinicivorans]
MKTAFLFPGQGSQKVGMMQDLAAQYESVRNRFEEADEALGWKLSELIFEGPAEKLQQTQYTQPAILTASVAAYDLLAQAGITAEYLAGHSLGEYSALVAAGSISFVDAVRTVHARGKFMQEAVPIGEGGMAAIIRLEREKIITICEEFSAQGKIVQAVNFNCPGQVVIAGTTDAVAAACEKMKEAGARRAIPLPVSAPFHSTLMQPAAEKLAQVLHTIEIKEARIPVIANVHAQPVHTSAEIRESLVEQAAHPVLWEDSMHVLLTKGVDTMVEVGPGTVLSGFMKKIESGVHLEHVENVSSLEATLAYFEEAQNGN